MQLDKQALELLALGRENPSPPLESLPISAVREQIDASLPAIGLAPEDVARTIDLEVPATPTQPACAARLYLPQGAGPGPLPTLLFLHGGGWACCGYVTHDALFRYFAHHTGAAVLALDYRLAPEHKFPCAVEDCVHALEWLLTNPRAELDATRLALVGDSAGGNLAAATAAHFAGNAALRHQLLLYPVLDSAKQYPSHAEYGSGYFLDTSTMAWFVDLYARSPADLQDPRFSPVLNPQLAGLAPTTLVIAGYDINRDSSLHYADLLRAAGVSCTTLLYENLPHGFASMAGFIPAAQAPLQAAVAALRRALA